MSMQEHIPLAPLTTFHIGGEARYFTRVKTLEELKESLAFARDKNLQIFILGGGSNLLVGDSGFDGLVIKIEIDGITQEGNTLIAGAGESWDTLVTYSVEHNLWGLENLSGIPGTVGGAVVGSIGAYGQAIAQTVVWVEVLSNGVLKRLANEECQFGYRESIFSNGSSVLVRAAFELSPSTQPNLSYKDLKERFLGKLPALLEVRDAVLSIRKDKFPDLAKEGTAGSFFKNPILSPASAQELNKKYPAMPLFEMPETSGVKIPLAWLLDHALERKGMRLGRARLYEKQPLVIVADREAYFSDVYGLAQKIKQEVKEKIGIEIQEEVRIV